MKKFIAFAMVLTMVFALAIPAMANPGQNPNKNPGSPEATVAGVRVTLTGGGNNMAILAICTETGAQENIKRAGNGTFNQSFEVFGYAVAIQVQGNSLRNVTVEPINGDVGGDFICDCDYVGVVTDPTCYEDGYTTYTCDNCGDSYVADETEATGCDYEAVVTAPTCTEDGYTTYTCTICGCTKVADETDALGHDYEYVVTKAPNPGNKGTAVCTCTRCGDSHTHVLAELNNNGNGNDNGTGDMNNACSTSANNPRVELCFCCAPNC